MISVRLLDNTQNTLKMTGSTSYQWIQEVVSCDISVIEEANLAEAWPQIARLSGLGSFGLAEQVASHFGLSAVSSLEPSNSCLQLVPESIARKHCLVPMQDHGQTLTVAMLDPTNQEAIQDTRFASGRNVEVLISAPELIQSVIDRGYKESVELASVARIATSHITSDTLVVRGQTVASKLDEQTPATEKLFLLILKEAINRQASDIHVQPFVGGAAVRLRIDGVMLQLKSMPLTVHQRLIRHVKALADLDVTNARAPQDGRLTLVANESQRDLRVSVLPVEQGERLVIRVLAHGVTQPGDLNFENDQASVFRKAMQNSSGIILVTGPTGSGKTTTLYSLLNLLNHDSSNIMSVEDPVEIRMSGVSQSSVHPEQGLSFPAVLRSMLRQDPDVILVGEIRDQETAELAIRAALTGHLVLSTLHTIDAVTTIPRLIDLGVSPILLADALLTVVNQRLIRKSCPHCAIGIQKLDATDFEALYLELTGREQVSRSTGCDACSHTGFSGRLPLGQVWDITDDVRNQLRKGDYDHESLEQLAMDHGLRPLTDAARRRIDAGLTSVEEAARVVGSSFWSSLGSEGIPLSESLTEKSSSMHEKLLIVEPDAELRESLKSELERRQYVVTAVANSDEAKEILALGEPLDLLLLDIESVSLSPLQSFNDLSASLSMLGLSTVILVPQDGAAVETLLTTHGATDYLLKPSSVERIADLCSSVLKRRHM